VDPVLKTPPPGGRFDLFMHRLTLWKQANTVRTTMLRHIFDEVVNEPVPDEFLSILKRADDRNRGGA